MEKTVSNGCRAKQITLDGSECKVTFDSEYLVFAVQADNKVTVALESGKIAGDDGVMVCKAGGSLVYPHMRTNINTVYITGSGDVQVVALNEAVNPFNQSGEGGDVKESQAWIFSAKDYIANAKYNSGYNLCGYNLSGDFEMNRLCICVSFVGYNLSHFEAVDFTGVKKITVKGAVTSNAPDLSSIVRCHIADAATDIMTDDWIIIQQVVGNDPVEFSVEIDCTEITGENFIHLAIEHGTENTAFTSYLYLDEVEFVY